MTQKNDVLDYLKSGKTITPLHALREFGCFRLAARIAELRDEGFYIHMEKLRVGDKFVGHYTLLTEEKL
jgi:hypothetical protein